MATGLASLFTGQPASPGVNPPPQGLLDLILGTSNPVSQFVDSRQNTLGAIGSGFAQGTNFGQGLALAAQGVPQARKADYATNLYRGQVSQTVQSLQGKYPDLAAAVVSGIMSPQDANAEVIKRSSPGYGTYTMAPGDVRYGPDNKPISGASNTNAPYGSDPKSWAYRTLQTADPSSPEYAEASNIIQTQTVTLQPDGKGGMVQVVNQQPMPTGFAPPSYNPLVRPGSPLAGGMPTPAPTSQSAAPPTVGDRLQQIQASPQASQVQFSGGAQAQNPAGGGVSVGQAIPGIVTQRAAPNESTNRIDVLSKMINSDVPTAVANFAALQSQKDQILQKDPTGLTNFAKDPKYQQAYAALNGVISNVLYTVSGAAIGDKEMERKVISMSPQIGDSTGVAVDKLRRFGDYVNAAAYGSNDPATVQAAQQATSQVSAVVSQMTKNDPIPVDTPQQAAALPHGAYFKIPDGRIKYNP